MNNLGVVCLDRGQQEEAADLFQTALMSLERLAHPHDLGNSSHDEAPTGTATATEEEDLSGTNPNEDRVSSDNETFKRGLAVFERLGRNADNATAALLWCDGNDNGRPPSDAALSSRLTEQDSEMADSPFERALPLPLSDYQLDELTSLPNDDGWWQSDLDAILTGRIGVVHGSTDDDADADDDDGADGQGREGESPSTTEAAADKDLPGCQLEVAVLIFNIALACHAALSLKEDDDHSNNNTTDVVDRRKQLQLAKSLYELSYNGLGVLSQLDDIHERPHRYSFTAQQQNDDSDDNDHDGIVVTMNELLMSLLHNLGRVCYDLEDFVSSQNHYTALATYLQNITETNGPPVNPARQFEQTAPPSTNDGQDMETLKKLFVQAILLATLREPTAAMAA